MQFQLVTLLSVAAYAVAASAESTSVAIVSEESTVTSSIEDCASTVTNCPARSSSAPAAPTTVAPTNGTNVTNGTVNPPQVTSYEGAGNALYAQAGVAAIAGVAALLL
ncbi:putative secreted protein [Wickerhamomyces ciferrii]|uniref:Secreted protein n=1 Tax=Wickerhamomyces ciferrii (strain ATCC 14091 / BCRC 22168 / CBS 111 / JCM 3599 / NBRC 0793 / NRRL Y-1031 F-60-10) TaxID=1206466 RepID=K0KU48_WICCF|nr:uncharacterized protein BN7_4311 [Wickerhamomyces ciferrii]CCH44743.1 putative secreted protein [Wickerhamomyces ciferrii]